MLISPQLPAGSKGALTALGMTPVSPKQRQFYSVRLHVVVYLGSRREPRDVHETRGRQAASGRKMRLLGHARETREHTHTRTYTRTTMGRINPECDVYRVILSTGGVFSYWLYDKRTGGGG